MTPKEALAILWEKDKVEAWEFIRTLVAKAEPIKAKHRIVCAADGKVIHEEWYCEICGHALYFDDNFCGSCGQAFIRSDEK